MMADCPRETLFLFASLFELGVLIFWFSMSLLRRWQTPQPSSLTTGQYDEMLLNRMRSVSLPDWAALQRSTDLPSTTIDHLRQGDLSSLSLRDLLECADALSWSLDEILEQFGLSQARQEIRALRQEGLRLREALQQQQATLKEEFLQATFQDLQSLLVNYPSLQKMVVAKPDLPAKNLVALLTGLDNWSQRWHLQTIGSAWIAVSFDPQLHQPDDPDIAMGETVYVRFVGYRINDRILCPAKVSRTLPAGVQA